MEYQDKESLLKFINSCSELVDGKFILADIKISKILKSISESPDVYDLIAENMINYDFDKEFIKCLVGDSTTKQSFELPEDSAKIIPLVFCLLVEIDSKRINFNDFIKEQFPFANNQNEEYIAFGKTVVIPFRDVIADYFEIDIEDDKKEDSMFGIIDQKIQEHIKNEIKVQPTVILTNVTTTTSIPVDEEEQDDEEEEMDLLFDRIFRLGKILEDKLICVRNPLKKSNISLLVDGLCEACTLKNVKIIVALIMALNGFAGNEKIMRSEIKELKNLCYEFYS